MTRPYKISIVGFSDAELEALSQFFLETAPPAPRFELAALPQQAELVIADGGNTTLLRQLKAKRLQAHVLLIGPSKEFPDLPFEHRPLNLPDVLRAVEYLLGIYTGKSAAPPPNAASGRTQPLPLQAVKSAAPKATAATEPMAVEPVRRKTHYDATEPMPMKAAPAKADYAATEPMGLQEPAARPGYDATQPMGFEALFQQAGYDAQPAWEEDGGIQPDEIAAFRAARLSADAPVPVGPVIMERVELTVEPDTPAPLAGPAHDRAIESTQNFLGVDAPPPAPVSTGPRALLVDNADVDARRIERLLMYMGYSVVRVRNAPDALALVGDGQFALVLVDTGLDGGGYGNCRALRQRLRAQSPGAVMLALGRVGGTFERLRARLAGCNACVVKPVDLAKLEAVIEANESAGQRQRG